MSTTRWKTAFLGKFHWHQCSQEPGLNMTGYGVLFLYVPAALWLALQNLSGSRPNLPPSQCKSRNSNAPITDVSYPVEQSLLTDRMTSTVAVPDLHHSLAKHTGSYLEHSVVPRWEY